MELKLQPCVITDLEKLVKISKETFIDAFEKDNDPEDFASYIHKAFNKEQLLSEMENKDTEFYFVFFGQELIGYLKLNKASAQSDIKDGQSLELERIYVMRQFQGKGAGKWLLDQVIQIARRATLSYIWLGVWEKNEAAIRFYLRHGFQQFGTHPYYIGKDKQTDFLMRLDL
ncbi:GNAT family N-acetyltransferase [uncultured Allomuricauda sp.]|uniref:GNAT family N-acetyltransferase n=1 Tax=Flagellimonas sp. W118 TaxID=3410791 RepID=UPI0026269843|nr:GNAT family N-acetyltransferase [uncultured Allomuricauda sp.]